MSKSINALSVKNLNITFTTPRGPLNAVRGVSFDLAEGETMGLVGESGSGKSTLALGVLRLLPSNGKSTVDSIELLGEDISRKSDKEMNADFRWVKMAYVPQAAMSALDPLYRVGDQFIETVRAHRDMSKEEILKKASGLLEYIGVDPQRLNNYPWELSGGQKQRVMIAFALILSPKLVILDEPTTALDTIIQAQILELFKQLKEFEKLSSIFISHDISVIANVADRVGVMYAGRLVEVATVHQLFNNPLHPYSQGLRVSVPDLRESKPFSFIPGTPPDMVNPPSGCPFHPRCPSAEAICSKVDPPLKPYLPGHSAACHFADRWVKQ